MIRVIVGDYEKLREIHGKSLKQMTFLKSKDTIEKKKIQDEKNGETLVIIGQNIVALENEDRKRFGIEDNKVVQAVNKVKQQLLGVNLGDGDHIPLPKTTNLKSENLDELGFDDAPELDITQSLMRVDQNKAEIEKGLEIFSQKLDQLSDMAGNISTELDDQGRILDDLDRKASNELERLKNLNKKVESALEKSGGLLRWIFVLVGAIIFCAVVAAIYVLVQNYITPIVRAFD
jgi:sensor histidine kinase YesM